MYERITILILKFFKKQNCLPYADNIKDERNYILIKVVIETKKKLMYECIALHNHYQNWYTRTKKKCKIAERILDASAWGEPTNLSKRSLGT